MEIKDLKVGDKVFVCSSTNNIKKLGTINRTTKTMIFVNNQRFNIRTGQEINSSWYSYSFIRIPSTKELEVYLYKQEAINLKRIIINKLYYCDLKKLKQIKDLLDDSEKKRES